MSGLLGGGGTISTKDTKYNTLQISSSTYGVAVPLVWGKTRISANLLEYIDFTAIEHTTTTSSGGKGGGQKQKSTTYTYTVAMLLGLCEGEVNVGRCWIGKEIKTLEQAGFTVFSGTELQEAWGYMLSKHPERAFPYGGLAYVAGVFDLGDDASLPNFNFEIMGKLTTVNGTDAHPKDILEDFLINGAYGVGLPVEYVGDWSQYSSYCTASGLFLSPALIEQVEANEFVTQLLQATNSEPVWSEGKLKIVPYGDIEITGNGVTFKPQNTPQYELTEDDFIGEDEPLLITRGTAQDAFNSVKVEYMNRANDYNLEIAPASDITDITDKGLRQMDTIELHCICDSDVANAVAQLILQRSLYVRNQYEFTLSWKYVRLEPMDIVLLTYEPLGLYRTPVRIKEIEEDEEGNLKFIAIDCPDGIASAPVYGYQSSAGEKIDFNVDGGSVHNPTIFTAPDELANGLELWMAGNGLDANWGGCQIWASEDNATYKYVGDIKNRSRKGYLTAELPVGEKLDTTNTLKVQLEGSNAMLLSGSDTDLEKLNTLCYADGEFLAYKTATLTCNSGYDLTYLSRGAYCSEIKSHAASSDFIRIDDSITKYPITKDQIGDVIYLKFVSYNIYGAGLQSLEEVEPVVHTIAWTAPPEVSNIGFEENTYGLADGTVFTDIELTCDLTDYGFVQQYDIYYEINGSGEWKYSGNTQNPNGYIIKAIPQADTVRVKIVTVSKVGLSTAGAVSDYFVIMGKNTAPNRPVSFTANANVNGGILLSWDMNQEGDIAGYYVYVGLDGASLANCELFIANYAGTSIVYPARESNNYVFHVVAVDTSGNVSPAASLAYTFSVPVDVTGFDCIQIGTDIDFHWNVQTDCTYELRRGVSWEISEYICSPVTNRHRVLFLSVGDHTFWIKAVDRYGNRSANAVKAEIKVFSNNDRNEILVIDEVANGWEGNRLNCHVYDGGLQLDDGAIKGEQIVSVELDRSFFSRVWVDSNLFAISTDYMTWDNATFTWESEEAESPWIPVVGASDISLTHQIAVLSDFSEDVVENFSLNNTVAGDFDSTVTEQTGVTYQPARFYDGAFIGDATNIAWGMDFPAVFSVCWWIKLSALITEDMQYLTLTTADGKSLYLRYEADLGAFCLTDSDNVSNTCVITPAAVDYIKVGISQSATTRTLYISSYSTNTVVSNEVTKAPLGAFTSMKCY